MNKIVFFVLSFVLISCEKKDRIEIDNIDGYKVEKYISSEKQIVYIKSDIDFHYFKVYNTSFPTKFVLKFKVKKDDIIVDKINIEKRIKVIFEENNNLRIINR